MNGWIHMPRSSQEFKTYDLVRGGYETFGYVHLAFYSSIDETEQGCKKAVEFFRKAKAIYSLLDNEVDARGMELNIAQVLDVVRTKHEMEEDDP